MSSNARLTLSTGHEVALPLETEARMDALVVSADATACATVLPEGLAPVRVWPGRVAVAFLSVAYDRVGDHALPPYDEFGVFVAASPTETTWSCSVPGFGPVGRGIGGYTVALPVTTEPARALGVEGWGYPKSVADVAVRPLDGARRTTVTDGDDHLATVEVRSTPRLPVSVATASFTHPDARSDARSSAERSAVEAARLRRQPLELSGRAGVRPLAGYLSLGDHPLARRLQGLAPGRPLASLSFEGVLTIHPNEPPTG